MATAEVQWAILESGCQHREITLQHQVPVPQGFATKDANSFDITTPGGYKLYRLRQAYANGGGLYVPVGPVVGAILAAGALAANVDARNEFSSGILPNTPAPAMLADRAIADRDCTQPIEDWSANLKCR